MEKLYIKNGRCQDCSARLKVAGADRRLACCVVVLRLVLHSGGVITQVSVGGLVPARFGFDNVQFSYEKPNKFSFLFFLGGGEALLS